MPQKPEDAPPEVLKKSRKFAYSKGEVSFSITYNLEDAAKGIKEVADLIEMLQLAIVDSRALERELQETMTVHEKPTIDSTQGSEKA